MAAISSRSDFRSPATLLPVVTDSLASAIPITRSRKVEFEGTADEARRLFRLACDAAGAEQGVAGIRADEQNHCAIVEFESGERAYIVLTTAWDAPDALRASHELMFVPDGGSAHGRAVIARVAEAVTALPYTVSERDGFRSEMPLLNGFVTDRRNRLPLRDFSMMMTGHLLTDLIPLINSVIELGVDPAHLTVLCKEYAYRERERVVAHIRSLGAATFRVSEVADALRHAGASDRPFLVLDDGGYVVPALIDREPGLIPRCAGVVEQTMSGILKLEPYADIPVPIFSVAQSRVKGQIESPWIADAAVANLTRLLPDDKLDGRPVLLIGYGQIGERIAATLADRRMRVAAYDRDIVRLVTAHERGFLTDTNLTDLLRSHRPAIVVGTSGRTSMSAAEFAALESSCFLASVSSRNTEFDLSVLTEMSSHTEPFGTSGTTYQMSHGPRVVLLADGYPINFHHSDSLTNSRADLVATALLTGICELAQPDHRFAPGHNLEHTDAAIESSGLLERYYHLYGPQRVAPALEPALDTRPAPYPDRRTGRQTPRR